MKKLFTKAFMIALVFLFVAAGVAGALVYHINDAAEAAKQEYKNEIDSYYSQRDDKIKNDVQAETETEIQRLKDETNQYLQEKLQQDYQNQINRKSAEIKKVTDQKIAEIKQYIDQIMEEKSK